MEILIYVSLFVCFVTGLRYPHLAIAGFAALLPLETRLPASIAQASVIGATPVAAIGSAFLIGAAIRLVGSGVLAVGAVTHSVPRMAGLVFIIWILVTSPTEALGLAGGRNWVLTFLQLWALFIVAGASLDTRRKHLIVMCAFAVACLASASIAIATGTIADDREVRSAGLAAGPNVAARYFVVGMVFFLFLQGQVSRAWLRLGAALGAAALMVGVLYTQSRTGLLLGIAALLLSPIVIARQRVSEGLLNLAAFAVVGMLLLPSGFVDSITLWFTPEAVNTNAQLEGLSGNLRWHLWEAGIDMWRDHPITGVGMDGFPRNALDYADVPISVRNPYPNLTPHSMYVALLSETGLVGFVLFLTMAGTSLRGAWRAHRASRATGVGAAWLVALLVLLFGAQLKNDIGEKLLWLAMGTAAALAPATTVGVRVSRRGVALPPRMVRPARPGARGTTVPGLQRRQAAKPR